MGNLERAKNITTMEKLVQGTVQNSTSGTSIDFTGIPSWAKKITVMFNGVSTSGTSHWLIQLGSTSIQVSGYKTVGSYNGASNSAVSSTSGFVIYNDNATIERIGNVIFNSIGSNTYIGSGVVCQYTNTYTEFTSGSVTLSGTLDRIRITTVNGTDTFDAGQINILVEG